MFRFVKPRVIMKKEADEEGDDHGREGRNSRPLRADAQRNTDALLEAALAVFAVSGVDAPVREIAEKAGVGIGTVYRHFPQRSDLIVAVFRHQVDACADAAPVLAAKHGPGEALARWMQRYADFIAAKRGLAAALHSGDPAFNSLPAYFDQRLRPALQTLLDAAAVGARCAPISSQTTCSERWEASVCRPAMTGPTTRGAWLLCL